VENKHTHKHTHKNGLNYYQFLFGESNALAKRALLLNSTAAAERGGGRE